MKKPSILETLTAGITVKTPASKKSEPAKKKAVYKKITRRETLSKHLPQPIIDLFMVNALQMFRAKGSKLDQYLDKPCKGTSESCAHLIAATFPWQETPEGEKFWDDVTMWVQDERDELPAIPEQAKAKPAKKKRPARKTPKTVAPPSKLKAKGTEQMLLVNVHVKLWGAERTDREQSQRLMKHVKANPEAGKVVKSLVDHAKYIKPLEKFRTSFKSMLYELTMPWSYGVRVVSVEGYEILKERFEKYSMLFGAAIEHFIDSQYDEAKEEAAIEIEGLGEMFKEGDYPTKEQLRSKFTAELIILPISTQITMAVPEGLKEEIEATVKKDYEARTTEALNKLVNKIDKALSDFAHKIPEAPAKWRDSTVQNLKDILEIAPALNVTGDERITKVVDTARVRLKALLEMETEELRKSTEGTRAELASQAKLSLADIRKAISA
jgi:hypothetical protein